MVLQIDPQFISALDAKASAYNHLN